MRGIQIDEFPNPISRAIRNARNDHAAIAVADEDHAANGVRALRISANRPFDTLAGASHSSMLLD